jgi:hypothetical protein
VVSDTLLVDGTDIQSADRIIQMWDDAVDTAVARGSNVVIPYAAGELHTTKVLDARDFTVGMAVKGATREALNTNIDALYAILPAPGDTCTLTRRRILLSGTQDKTATAEFLGGVSPRIAAPRLVRLTLRFRLLDGDWA